VADPGSWLAAAVSLIPASWQEEHRGATALPIPVPGQPGEAIGDSRRHALIVGIDDYADPSVPDLSCAVADATAIAGRLATDWGFREDEIRLLLGAAATKAAIEEALQDWAVDSRRVGDPPQNS
jgi:hypothetical protein